MKKKSLLRYENWLNNTCFCRQNLFILLEKIKLRYLISGRYTKNKLYPCEFPALHKSLSADAGNLDVINFLISSMLRQNSTSILLQDKSFESYVYYDGEVSFHARLTRQLCCCLVTSYLQH